MNKLTVTTEVPTNPVLEDCVLSAFEDSRFDSETLDSLLENPRCPLLVLQDIGRTAALYTACEGCPVFDQIQKEQEVRREQKETAEKLIAHPVLAIEAARDSYTKGLKRSAPDCTAIPQLFGHVTALSGSSRERFLASGQVEINDSSEVLALEAYIAECMAGEKIEEAQVAESLLGLIRTLPGMFYKQLAANVGRANGARVNTAEFTEVTGFLYSYCTLRSQTTLKGLKDLVKAGRPAGNHSGMAEIADKQVQSVKGEIAVGKVIVGMEGASVRRGTPDEDRRGGDFVLERNGNAPIRLDVKCFDRCLSVHTETDGPGKPVKLIIPDTRVTEGLALNQKDSDTLRQLVLELI